MTVEYDGDKPVRVDTVVISTQHAADVSLETIRRDMMHYVIPAVIPAELLDENTKYYDNRISVKVLRSDGSEFFSRTFTKKDFTSYIDKHTQDMGALLGIVYVKAEVIIFTSQQVLGRLMLPAMNVYLWYLDSRMVVSLYQRMRSWIPTLLLKRKKRKKMGYKAVLPLTHNEKFMAIRTFWIKFHA